MGYNESVDPSIDTFFTNVAFRYGHSAVNSIIYRLKSDLTPIEGGHLLLRDAIWAVDPMIEVGIEPYLRGLHFQPDSQVDIRFVEDVRSRFPFNFPDGFDLIATGIQRSREVGICRYNDARRAFNLSVITDWTQLSSNEKIQQTFKELYRDVESIESYMGAFNEADDIGITGPLMRASIREQFTRLRDGDPFFYKRAGVFQAAEAEELQTMTLGKLISLNTGVQEMPNNPFVLGNPDTNATVTRKESAASSFYFTPDYQLLWTVSLDSISFQVKTNYTNQWFAFGLGETMNSMKQIFLFRQINDGYYGSLAHRCLRSKSVICQAML